MAEQKPVAWAVFAANGNIRMWSTVSDEVKALVEVKGLTLTPLYTDPREELPRCPRCMKIISGYDVHTCTPTAAWRQIEKQNEELLQAITKLKYPSAKGGA